MKNTFLNKVLKGLSGDDILEETGEDYVEIDMNKSEDQANKILVKPFTIQDFADIKEPLDALRDGNIIGLLNIAPLREKDIHELKRSLNKIKKTCQALDGDIAGFGEDWVVITPSFARIFRQGLESASAEQI
ncbi:cell division protein SepF [Candidatus Woesearchaeota archaeon]|nr:hypothetical protein [uncultured archaeon]MBS3167258.1 cell division protein SepF [Candidatus Woesearchaeota archaeon]